MALRRVEGLLQKKYRPVMKDIAERVSTSSTTIRTKKIWFCWLQGMEDAPEVVKACYNSLALGEWFRVNGYEVIVIDEKNWREYVKLPDYIIRRREKKQIPSAHFSDLLRL